MTDRKGDMEMKDVVTCAFNLIEGGWCAGDREEIEREYDIHGDDLTELITTMEIIERG